MTVHVLSDSTCELPRNLADELGVTVVPLTISFGDERFEDGVNLSATEFYERLRASKELPKTSQPSVEAFRRAYESLPEGDEIVSIHLSSRLSGTLNSASIAREELSGRNHIELIDSYSVSLGLGAIVLDAAEAARAGGTAEQVVAAARRTMDRHHLVCALDTLEYLQKGGRIGRARSMLGSLLSVKPLVHIEDGEVAPLERVRTRAKAMERLREIATEDRTIRRLLVGCAGNDAEAAEFAASLGPALPHTDIRVLQVSPIVGVYAGPGAMGICTVRRD